MIMSKMELIPTTVTQGTVIKGFKGEIYDGVRGNMQEKRFQYATSSYDNMMNPAIIVYPLDEEDVSLAVKWATMPEFTNDRKSTAHPSGYPLKVIGHGGGHQYCGVSCDNGALIISMDNFQKLEIHNVQLEGVTGPDGHPHNVTKEVHVGTGLKLKELATFFKNSGVTIPHGECPGVGIGGHSQTGGYGHLARNFGLAIDYVYGFTIVTANGEIRNINRDSKKQADKDLYWAVLGGSPGAFGITTNLIIHPILDEDYPHSTGWTTTMDHTPKNMEAVLGILENFINRAKESDDDCLAEGLDLMVSLSSHNNNLCGFVFSKIIVEMVCRDMMDAKAYRQMNDIIQRFEKETKHTISDRFENVAIQLVPGQGNSKLDGRRHYALSELSYHFVRSVPSVTASGRENKNPYRKAAYGSKDKLKPGWSKAFAELLNDVVATKHDIACIFQVVVGGGAQARLGQANMNSISHRDVQLSSVVFDLFHGENDHSI
jgi:hypothetical protein